MHIVGIYIYIYILYINVLFDLTYAVLFCETYAILVPVKYHAGPLSL